MLYGLGKKSLAERLNCDEEKATEIIEGLFTAYPRLKEFIAEQQEYPMQHDGYINTFLGDKLRVDEWKYYKKSKTSWERKNLEARIKRLGVIDLPTKAAMF